MPSLRTGHKVRNIFDINALDRVAIVGVGLLGGSIGLALRARGFSGTRVGIGRRLSSLRKAMAYDAVDEVTREPASGVVGAQLVILCSPIGRFESLLERMIPGLTAGAIITDVGSTKREVVATGERILAGVARFVGSHPMAGSEKTGVEFARADLFEEALCLVTPTPHTARGVVRFIRAFWETLGGKTTALSPERHDHLLAQVSHLPHAVAAALVHLSLSEKAINLAGPGFADTTRIASGEPGMWAEIFRSNRPAMMGAIDRLSEQLAEFRRLLERDDAEGIYRWLALSQHARDLWISRRYRKKKG